MSDAVPSTTTPLEGQRELVANKELCGGNTTNETSVIATETVRGPALLEGSEFPSPSDIEDTDNAEGDRTSEKLSDGLQVMPDDQKQQSGPESVLHERNTTETTARITMPSTKLQQKVQETQGHLGSGSEMKNTQKYPQVRNIPCIVAVFVCLDTPRVKAIAVDHLPLSLSNKCAGIISYAPNGIRPIGSDCVFCFQNEYLQIGQLRVYKSVDLAPTFQ